MNAVNPFPPQAQPQDEQEAAFRLLSGEDKIKWARAVELSAQIVELRQKLRGLGYTPKHMRADRQRVWEKEHGEKVTEITELVHQLPILKKFL